MATKNDTKTNSNAKAATEATTIKATNPKIAAKWFGQQQRDKLLQQLQNGHVLVNLETH